MDDQLNSELKQMILSFRVSELHQLLDFAGSSKKGRKSQLQARSIKLLPVNSIWISRKIRELHATLQPKLQNSLLPPSVAEPTEPIAEPIAEKPPAMQPHGNSVFVGYYGVPQQQVNAREDNVPQQQLDAREDNVPQQQLDAREDNVPQQQLVALLDNTLQQIIARVGNVVNRQQVDGHFVTILQRMIAIVDDYVNQQQVNGGAGLIHQQHYRPHQDQPQDRPVVHPYVQLPVSPDVRFKQSPFGDLLGVILRPTLVTSENQPVRVVRVRFHLTRKTADLISRSRDRRHGTPIGPSPRILLRFCRLENTSEQEDSLPPHVLALVNSKIIPPWVGSRGDPELKRSVDITHLIKLNPDVENLIEMLFFATFGRDYFLTIQLVMKKTSQDLLNELKNRGVRASRYTHTMIINHLKEDSDITATTLRFSLACPLGKKRMTTPCRASTCNHFQCFDAAIFFQMNEKKPKWNCPVCNNSIIYKQLVIDGYFQDVLCSPSLPKNCTEIRLHKDGTWEPLVEDDVAVAIAPMKKVVRRASDPPCVTLFDDGDNQPSLPRKRPTWGSGLPHPLPYPEAELWYRQVQPTPQRQDQISIITLN